MTRITAIAIQAVRVIKIPFEINKEVEQQRLLNADIIVLQFPFFWYGVPSIMSRWMEETFVHGFSHGSTGDKLKGRKRIFTSIKTIRKFMLNAMVWLFNYILLFLKISKIEPF